MKTIKNREDLFILLLDAYKSGGNVSEDTIITYGMMLADVPFPALKAGIIKCIAICKYFPTIAEIRTAAQEVAVEVSGTKLKDFAEAWSEVTEAVKKIGYYGKPTWSSQEIEEAVQAFGWIELCTVEQKDINVVRAQFKGIYNAICDRSEQKDHNLQAFCSLSAAEKKQLNPAEKITKEITIVKKIVQGLANVKQITEKGSNSDVDTQDK